MQTLDQLTQLQITDLVEACGSYWTLRGVSPERQQDMQMELEQHLAQALRDGKALETVVGLNPSAFAEAWAREIHPRWFPGGTLLLHGLASTLCLLSFIALSSQLLLHTPSFTLTPVYPFVFVGLGLFVLLARLSGFLSPRFKTQDSRLLLVFLTFYLPLLSLALLQRRAWIKIDWHLALLSWSWPVTILLLVGSLVLAAVDGWLLFQHRRCGLTGYVNKPDIVFGFFSVPLLAVAVVTANQVVPWLCAHV